MNDERDFLDEMDAERTARDPQFPALVAAARDWLEERSVMTQWLLDLQARHRRWIAARNWFYETLCLEMRRSARWARFDGRHDPYADGSHEAIQINFGPVTAMGGRLADASLGSLSDYEACLDDAETLFGEVRSIALAAFGGWCQ